MAPASIRSVNSAVLAYREILSHTMGHEDTQPVPAQSLREAGQQTPLQAQE